MITRTFSQRMGLETIRDTIQINDLDTPTRNALWNIIGPFFTNSSDSCSVYIDIWTQLYLYTSDTRPEAAQNDHATINDHYYAYYRSIIINGEFNKCLDLIEFLNNNIFVQKWQSELDINLTLETYNTISVPREDEYNNVFEKFMVGYRLIDGQITPITNDEEKNAIEEAIQKSQDAVVEQLTNALRFISNRKAPDYAKSVHCSISAVEAQCKLLLNNARPTLHQALDLLKIQGANIHPSLNEAFDKLYGFTSDASGIRHGNINPSDVDADLAKFMIISCSAFVNYLRSKEK